VHISRENQRMVKRPATRRVCSCATKLTELRRHPFLAGLPLEEIERLSIYVPTRTYPRGASIFARGDAGTTLFAVCSGTVRIGVPSRDGREVVFNLVKTGEIFGEISLLDGRPRTADATTLTDCVVMEIDRRNFMALLENQPQFALKLIGLLCARLRHTSEQVEDVLFSNSSERLAKLLVRLSRSVEISGSRRRIRMTQHEIARMIGVSRENINRQSREWQERSWVRIERGSITVLAPEALDGWD
jgi:CRP/FNR family transcriptional regulator, cyclic AMP receptor protein